MKNPNIFKSGLKEILPSVILFLAISLFSNTGYAQRDAGGSSGGDVSKPCPVSFKRNNGNGWGVCGGDSQIRVTFSELPDVAPQLTAIYYTPTNGEKVQITSVYLPVNGDFISKTHPYISYCLTGSLPAPGNSQGNIPPAVKLTLEFTYPSGQVCTTDIEE